VGLILIIILVIFLLGGFSGRFGGYGYGFGHGGMGIIGLILVVILVLVLLGRLELKRRNEPPPPAPGVPLHQPHRLVESSRARGQRWHPLDRKPDRRRCGSGRDAARRLGRGSRGAGGRRHVDGRRRVCVRQLAIRHRTGGSRARAQELAGDPASELDELAEIYVKRGVDEAVARQVAQQLMAKDALGAHARDELGISEITTARPVQAALTSAASFSVGAAMPLLMVFVLPVGALVGIVSAASLAFLAFLGAIGARAGGANVLRGTARVTFWGALAMAITAVIGKLVGTVV